MFVIVSLTVRMPQTKTVTLPCWDSILVPTEGVVTLNRESVTVFTIVKIGLTRKDVGKVVTNALIVG